MRARERVKPARRACRPPGYVTLESHMTCDVVLTLWTSAVVVQAAILMYLRSHRDVVAIRVASQQDHHARTKSPPWARPPPNPPERPVQPSARIPLAHRRQRRALLSRRQPPALWCIRRPRRARQRPKVSHVALCQSMPSSDRVCVAINLDARDPVLASRLHSLGAVQPNPHYSASSTSSFDPRRNESATLPSDMMNAPPQNMFPDPGDNPALRVLEARQRIQDEADQELANMGRKGFAGRNYVDAGVIQLALMRRARGEPDARIEEALMMKKGRLGVLGRGIVGTVSASA